MINVKAVWKEESREWNPNFRRSLLSREKDLWNQISAEWKQPTSNTENDYYKWKHTVGGLFTVKSMKKKYSRQHPPVLLPSMLVISGPTSAKEVYHIYVDHSEQRIGYWRQMPNPIT